MKKVMAAILLWLVAVSAALGQTLPVKNLSVSGTITVSGSTAHGLTVGQGSSAFTWTAPGTAGQPLLSGGASADPTYGTLGVSGGGLGLTSIPQYNVLLGNGTSAVSTAAPSATAGLPLVSNGSSANPSFAVAVPAGGGTGLATLAAHGVMLGEGTANVSLATPSVGSSGYALLSNGPTSDPSFQQLTGAQINYNEGNVNAVTRTLTNRLKERISVMDFGCDNTGATDDSTCFSNAVSSLPASGGDIYVPSGVYLVNAFPSLAGKINVRFHGAGGVTAGAQAATEIKIGLTGSGNFINAPGSVGILFEDIQFVYSSSSFTGWIASGGNNGSDASFLKFRRCSFFSNASSLYTASGINLDKTIEADVEDNVFSGLSVAIQGYTGTPGTDYSNVATIARNQFSNTRFAPIEGGGQSWVVVNNTFEAFNNGTTGNTLAGSLSVVSPAIQEGLQYIGNWHGDASTTGGTWVTVYGGGINIAGNWFGGNSGSNAISANNIQGLSVKANKFVSFSTALSCDTTGTTGLDYSSNQFNTVTNQIGSPANCTGLVMNGANLSVSGTGAMPEYSSGGGAISAPHMVYGSVTLSTGSASVTFSGSAVFTSGGSFVCTATDYTAANPVRVNAGSGSAITITGTGSDLVAYTCTGN